MKFIALCSSRGTTLKAVFHAIADGSVSMECFGLITDHSDRQCIEKAEIAGVPVRIVEKSKDDTREEYDKKVHAAIVELGGNKDDTVIAALGWMFILSPWFIAEWRGRIINVHPALLPKYGGKGMYGDRVHSAVLAAGESESGISIHLMDEGVDTGKILVQKSCTVTPDDTVESLKMKVQGLEKEWYPKTLQMIQEGEIQL